MSASLFAGEFPANRPETHATRRTHERPLELVSSSLGSCQPSKRLGGVTAPGSPPGKRTAPRRCGMAVSAKKTARGRVKDATEQTENGRSQVEDQAQDL